MRAANPLARTAGKAASSPGRGRRKRDEGGGDRGRQRRLHAQAGARPAESARAPGHRVRAARHQCRESRHGDADPPSATSPPTSCRPASPARSSGAHALAGARYVICCVRVGGLEAFAHDIEVPLRYGVDQCVGDTICAGGIMYGQRTIPQMLAFCADIRAEAEPDAWLLNYANPMAMNTWAAIEHGGVANTIGLCHGVQNGWRQIAEVLGAADPNEVDYICTGINHQTWYVDIRFRGRQDRRRGAACSIRAASAHARAGEGAHRRAAPLRRLFDREQRASQRIPAVVPQAARGDRPLDRPLALDQWRDRRLSSPLHRAAQLVRDRLPALARRSRRAARGAMCAPTSMRATSSRRSRPGASIAGISTCATRAW